MKLENLLEKLIMLRLSKSLEKSQAKETKEEVKDEGYSNPKEDGKPMTIEQEILKQLKARQKESKPTKKEPTLEEKARDKDKAISSQRATMEVSKNGK